MAHTLLLTSAITLTPGTAVVEIDRDRSTLFLHLLHMDRRSQVEGHVVELASLSVGRSRPHNLRSRRSAMEEAALVCFAIAGLCGTIRLTRGPSLADRVIALDVSLISLMGAITVDAARRSDTTYLIALVVLAIIGFTATVAASRFIEDSPPPESAP